MTRDEGFREIVDLINSKKVAIAADTICSLFESEGFVFTQSKQLDLASSGVMHLINALNMRVDQLEQAGHKAVCLEDVRTIFKAEVDELKNQYIELQKQVNDQAMAIKALQSRTMAKDESVSEIDLHARLCVYMLNKTGNTVKVAFDLIDFFKSEGWGPRQERQEAKE
jgi:hypothetical protein